MKYWSRSLKVVGYIAGDHLGQAAGSFRDSFGSESGPVDANSCWLRSPEVIPVCLFKYRVGFWRSGTVSDAIKQNSQSPTPGSPGGRWECKPSKKAKNYNTDYSQVVSHPSTRSANARLTSEIRRDPVKLVCMVVADDEVLSYPYSIKMSDRPIAVVSSQNNYFISNWINIGHWFVSIQSEQFQFWPCPEKKLKSFSLSADASRLFD